MNKLFSTPLLIWAIFIAQSCWAAEPITFFIAADTHIGWNQTTDNELKNREAIEDMNALPGAKAPWSDDEEIGTPRGVLIAGDLTQSSSANWAGFWLGSWRYGFDQLYQVSGEGILKFPVYEGYGNHDLDTGFRGVLSGIYLRNKHRSTPVTISDNGLHYSWEWDGVHFINLNLCPGHGGQAYNSLAFLEKDLAQNLKSPRQPVIIYHHLHHASPDWPVEEKQDTIKILEGYNVIAIFIGHTHTSFRYRWHGIDVFGVPKIHGRQYYVCQIKDGALYIGRRINGGWKTSWKKQFEWLHGGE